MTDTGWRLPTGNTQVSGSWTNPTNIYNETVNYAQIAIAAKNVVYELAGTTFGFSTSIIPDDAIIDTVNFRYRSYQSSTTQASTGGQPYLGATAGTEHTQDTGSATTLTWDATAERPGGGDWQPADFRDGTLTVRLRAKQGNTNTSRTYYFDYVEVQVIFHTPIVWDGAAKFDGVGDFQADAEVPVIWDGAAKFDGVGDFQSDANVDHYVADGAALIEGVGGLLADTSVITGGGGTAWDGAAQFDAVGDLKSIDDTVLLLHFDGDFIDAVGRHQVLFKNTPTIVTDRFKFGDSSLFVNAGWAENDGLQITGSESDFAFGTGDFCIDLWVINNQGGPPGWGTLFITGNTDSQVYLQTNGNGVVSLGVGGGRIVGTTQLAQFVPYHIALTRASGQTRLFVQGVQEGITLTDNTDYDVLAGYPLIGTNTGYQNWQGWIDEVHVIKGRSVWTENFTPPELPYPGGIFISHYAAEGNSQFDTVGNLVFGAADVALLLHGSDFTDSTGKHAPPTLGGSVSIDTTQFKFDGASFNFTGAGGRIQFDGSDDFAFGTGDFTVDFWTKLTTQGWRVFYDGNPSGDISDNYPFIACVNGGAVYIGYPTRKITGTTTLQVDIWYHIALTRSASNLRLFVDGIQEGGTYTDNTNYLTGSLAPAIGTRNLDYAEYLIGRLDELRVIKGRAAWTEDFEPPTAPYELGAIVLHYVADGIAQFSGSSSLSDIEDDLVVTNDTVLLLHFDADFSDAVDQHQITAYGDAHIDTGRSIFGGASALFDGVGDYVKADYHGDFVFGAGDFTIDFWFWGDSTNGNTYGNLLEMRGSDYANNCLNFDYNPTTQGIRLGIGNNDTGLGAGAVTADNWHHFAVTRSGTTLRSFVDGALRNTGQRGDNLTCSITNGLRIGSGNSGTFKGSIEEFRIIKGRAAWTDSFTVPDRSYSGGIFVRHYVASGAARFNGAGNSAGDPATALLHFDTDFSDVAGGHLFTVVGTGVGIDTTQKQFGAGSLVTPGNGSYLKGDGSSDFAFGLGDFTIDFFVRIGVDTHHHLIDFSGVDATPNALQFEYLFAGVPAPRIRVSASGVGILITDPVRSTNENVWTHIAFSRKSGQSRLFVGGKQVGSTYTDTINYAVDPNGPAIGLQETGGSDWFDEFRVVKGIALWDSDFIPPTAPYSIGGQIVQVLEAAQAEFTGASALDVDATTQTPGAQTWDGNALLAGDGGLAVDISITHAILDGAAKFDGETDFKVDATEQGPGAQTWDGNALLAGAGGLLIDATVSHYIAPGAGLLAGAGSCAVDTTVSHYLALGAGLLSGTGTVLSDAVVTHYVADGSAQFIGVGGFLVAGIHTPNGLAKLDGAGALLADSYIKGMIQASAALAGAGGLPVDATVSHYVANGAGLLAGVGAFPVDATVLHYLASGAGLLSGAGNLLSDATITHYVADGSAKFIGAGGFLVAGTHTPDGASRFNGAGALLVDSYIKGMIQASAALPGVGIFVSDATVLHYVANGSALLAGVGLAQLDVTVLHYVASGASLLTGAGNLLSDAAITHYVADGSAKFTGVGGFLVAGIHTPDAASRFNGAGNFLADSYIKGMIQANAALAGAGGFKADVSHTPVGTALLAGVGNFVGDASFKGVILGNALFAGTGNVTARAIIIDTAAAARFDGVGNFVAPVGSYLLTRSSFAGLGHLYVDTTTRVTHWAEIRFDGVGVLRAAIKLKGYDPIRKPGAYLQGVVQTETDLITVVGTETDLTGTVSSDL